MPAGRRRISTTSISAGLDTLGELFSSRIRASVLAYLVAREEARFSLTELSRALNLSVSSVQHECYKLERLGVLKGRREGASRRYWLDRDQEFVPVLMWLVVPVVGSAQVLAYALQDISGLQAALITNGDQPALTLIGDLGLDDLANVQERAEKILDVPAASLAVAFYDPLTWQQYRETHHPSIAALQSTGFEVLLDTGTMLKDLNPDA